MLYLVSIIVPPLAILLCGKHFQAIFSLILLVFPLLILARTLGIGSGISFALGIRAIRPTISPRTIHAMMPTDSTCLFLLKSP